mmetsp:Transcript_13928/g.13904  ORF Transcript_13928/g.13904 Transcript_13928/m.13904 type:complete len:87 (+) Transcript_13928:1056-1316(+)
MYGEEELTTTVDFSKIKEEEQKYYSPGGRVFLDANFESVDASLNSYGFFFEVAGYKEPTPTVDIWFILIAVFLSLFFAAFVGLIIY